MKKIVILLILSFPILLLAQNSMGTSHDEYKYLSKGYAYQKDMGLNGDKAGYAVKSLYTASNGIKFDGLFTTTNQFKGVIVTINPNTEKPIYLGLPTNNATAEIKNKSEDDIQEKLNLKAKEAYDIALLEFALYQVNGDRVPYESVVAAPKKVVKKEVMEQTQVEEYNTIVPLKIERKTIAKDQNTTNSKGVGAINNNVSTNHDLSTRAYVQSPVVKGQAPYAGTVVIKICVDQSGTVKTAKFTQRGSTTLNSKLKKMALNAAKNTTFTEGENVEECGTIKFEFKI